MDEGDGEPGIMDEDGAGGSGEGEDGDDTEEASDSETETEDGGPESMDEQDGESADEGAEENASSLALSTNITAAEVAMVLLRRYGQGVLANGFQGVLTNGFSPKMITKKLLNLRKIKLGEDEEGFADVERRVQSVLDDNMDSVFTQHQSEAQCFCLSELGQTLATEAVQHL